MGPVSEQNKLPSIPALTGRQHTPVAGAEPVILGEDFSAKRRHNQHSEEYFWLLLCWRNVCAGASPQCCWSAQTHHIASSAALAVVTWKSSSKSHMANPLLLGASPCVSVICAVAQSAALPAPCLKVLSESVTRMYSHVMPPLRHADGCKRLWQDNTARCNQWYASGQICVADPASRLPMQGRPPVRLCLCTIHLPMPATTIRVVITRTFPCSIQLISEPYEVHHPPPACQDQIAQSAARPRGDVSGLVSVPMCFLDTNKSVIHTSAQASPRIVDKSIESHPQTAATRCAIANTGSILCLAANRLAPPSHASRHSERTHANAAPTPTTPAGTVLPFRY